MRRFGKKVYDGSNDIQRKCIGIYICPLCHKESKLIEQKNKEFRNILSRCDLNHTFEMAKELYQKYYVGDRIRYYESTFGKDAVLRLDSYTEGVVVNTYPGITSYNLDFKVDTCVMNGHEIKSPAWVIGHIVKGVRHGSAELRLLKRANKSNYTQLAFDLTEE